VHEAVTGASSPQLFGDRVAGAVTARQSQLMLGLDPDPSRLWPQALEVASAADPAPEGARAPAAADPRPGAAQSDPRARAARAVAAHCALVLEAVAAECVAVKLQVACFERLGAPGWAALEQAAAVARDHGLLVIADAKRGDIEVTAAAYAEAYFGETSTPFGAVRSLGADALTVNPLLGTDSMAPLVGRAREHGAGVFVLARTSNPGAADVQGLALAAGGTVSDRLAEMIAELGAEGTGDAGLADVGAVVGATAPEWVAALRELMPRAVFLLPGVGAQGGEVEALGPAFAPGPAGGLVSASRGIVAASERLGGDPAAAARREAARLREAVWRVAS
jgi:orotidine-5'-phosphate decarboxylase